MNKNNYEIEYKYLVDKIPFDKNLYYEKKYIEQIYFQTNDNINNQLMDLLNLDTLDNINTFRVRKIIKDSNISYIITLKSKGKLIREEYETEISEDLYLYLGKDSTNKVIKNRYVFNIDDYTFEFDEYLNINNDILTVEVEVDSLDINIKNKIEKIMNDKLDLKFNDVTNEKKYKNKYLVESFGIKKID